LFPRSIYENADRADRNAHLLSDFQVAPLLDAVQAEGLSLLRRDSPENGTKLFGPLCILDTTRGRRITAHVTRIR
jgi:hypothetical protein